jgi:hypothetical protein
MSLIVVELEYVTELPVLLRKRKMAAPDGDAPVIVLPFALMSLRRPKYTLVCAPRLTPVHVIVAPATPVVPLTLQLPPPAGRTPVHPSE